MLAVECGATTNNLIWELIRQVLAWLIAQAFAEVWEKRRVGFKFVHKVHEDLNHRQRTTKVYAEHLTL